MKKDIIMVIDELLGRKLPNELIDEIEIAMEDRLNSYYEDYDEEDEECDISELFDMDFASNVQAILENMELTNFDEKIKNLYKDVTENDISKKELNSLENKMWKILEQYYKENLVSKRNDLDENWELFNEDFDKNIKKIITKDK